MISCHSTEGETAEPLRRKVRKQHRPKEGWERSTTRKDGDHHSTLMKAYREYIHLIYLFTVCYIYPLLLSFPNKEAITTTKRGTFFHQQSLLPSSKGWESSTTHNEEGGPTFYFSFLDIGTLVFILCGSYCLRTVIFKK